MTPRIIAANLEVRLKSFYREKSALFFTFLFPVILVLVFGTIFTKPEKLNFELPVQDLSRSESSAKLLEHLVANNAFVIRPVPADVDAIRYAKDHKLTLLVVIPADFDTRHKQRFVEHDDGASVDIPCIIDPSSTSAPTKINLLKQIVAEANQQATSVPPFFKLVETSILSARYRFIEFFVPGIIAMAIMTSSLSNALNMNAELRQKGILRKLATTPITRADWMVSGILYQMILAAISTVTILVTSYAVFDVRLHLGPLLPVLVCVEVIAFVGIGMVLTPFAKEAESANAVSNAILFPMMFLSGTFFPVEMMPGFLQVFAKALPLYYVNEGLRASMIFSDFSNAIRCIGILGAFALVVFVTGLFTTKWDERS